MVCCFGWLKSDKKMFEEQKHIIQRISLVVLSGTKTKLIQTAHQRIRTAVEKATPKGHVYIDLLERT